MRKIFTLAAAVMASFSLWAAAPDFESFNWGADDFATVFADHDGIVISSDASAWKGNFSGIQYVALGGGTDMSASSPTPYFGVTAAAGIDSVEIYWCPNGGDATNLAWIAWDDAANFKQQQVNYKGEGPEYTGSKSIDDAIWQKFDFSATDEKAILFGRQLKKVMYEGSQYQFGKNKTVNILGVRVWLHETKTIVSTTEELINAKVNGVALEEGKLNELKYGFQATLDDNFITAPEVTFVKRVEITYDDQSTKVDTVDVDVTAIESTEASGMWQASITLGETTYSLFAGIAEAYTVTYLMIDGDEEIVLGTELVAVGEHPAEYAQYEVRPLCTFTGWFDEDYEEVDMTQVVVNENMSFYADFEKAYAQSIDFEGMVINNGKSYNVKSALDAKYYDYKTIDALDSLNNSKGAARNEPYLGLKIKKQGGYIACNVLPGTTLRIKFGYVAETVLAIAGNDTLRLVPTDNKLADLTVPFAIEKLVKLQTTSDKTVVIKQIMIDQPIATWMYPITYADAEHGTVSGWTIALPGEEVKVSHAAAEGYRTYSLTYNGVALHDDENKGYVTFTMPAEAVAVEAEFLQEFPTAIENTEAEVKAVKVIRDGKLFIEKNGVLYDAQGVVVK